MASKTELEAEVERLQKLLAEKKQPGKLTLKISEKGALSVYGLGRFPVILYKEQWKRLIEFSGDIAAFIAANDSALKTKE